MKRFQDDFPALLNGFNLDTLENDPNTIFGLSERLILNYLNPAWFDFAKENQGEPAVSERFALGAKIGDAMVGPVRDFYLEAFRNTLQSGRVWHHDYECSSPDKFRLYHQSVYPLYYGKGLVVVNSLVKEQPHDPKTRSPHEPMDKLYTQDTGFITQCSNCRRVQRAPQAAVWDWVPAWVECMPENTSHTFCSICFEYYYQSRYPTPPSPLP